MEVSSSGKPICDYDRAEAEEMRTKNPSSQGSSMSHKLYYPDRSSWERRQNRAASAGTVSSFIGKDYTNYNRTQFDALRVTESVKLSKQAIPVSEPGESIDSSNKEPLSGEMKELVVKMLSDGFYLDEESMKWVIGKSGYKLEKGLESERTEPSNDEDKDSSELSSHVNAASNVEEDLSNNNRGEPNIENAVLVSLFEGTEKKTRLSRRPVKPKTRPISLGKLVESPYDLDSDEEKSASLTIPDEDDTVIKLDDEDPYVLNLKSAEEYRITMVEYYKAAVEALQNGDTERSNRLMAQGGLYSKKAYEADEESAKMMFNTSDNAQIDDYFSLDLHNWGPKEAVRLLKSHIGAQAFSTLKVILEENGKEDSSKGARRRLVIKYLEKESIPWREDEAYGTILIPLDP